MKQFEKEEFQKQGSINKTVILNKILLFSLIIISICGVIVLSVQNYKIETLKFNLKESQYHGVELYKEKTDLILELETLKLEFINYKINNSKIELELYNKFLEKGYLTREDLKYEKSRN